MLSPGATDTSQASWSRVLCCCCQANQAKVTFLPNIKSADKHTYDYNLCLGKGKPLWQWCTMVQEDSWDYWTNSLCLSIQDPAVLDFLLLTFTWTPSPFPCRLFLLFLSHSSCNADSCIKMQNPSEPYLVNPRYMCTQHTLQWEHSQLCLTTTVASWCDFTLSMSRPGADCIKVPEG